jgi:DNA-binding IclR family transcriptional regulator
MLAHLNIVHLMPPGASAITTLDRHGRVPESRSKLRPVRLRDLAQITGRPRETIRRKLEHMRSLGLAQRLPDGWVYDPSSVDADMQALTVDSIRRFMQTADVMRSILQEAAAAVRQDAAAPVESTRRKGRP